MIRSTRVTNCRIPVGAFDVPTQPQKENLMFGVIEGTGFEAIDPSFNECFVGWQLQ